MKNRFDNAFEQRFFASCQNLVWHFAVLKKEGGRRRNTTRSFLHKCQPPACQRLLGGNERQERKGAGQEDDKHREDIREGAQCQAKKTGTSRRKSRRQPWALEKGSENSVVVHTMWRQKRQWCLGRSEHIFLLYAWQIDVKASVYNAWQISPIFPLLVKGAFLLDGT